jgi:hypothetical protein
VKTPGQVLEGLRRKLDRTWHLNLQGTGADWPVQASLGRPTAAQLSGAFPAVQQWALDWQDFARDHDLELQWSVRRSGSSTQRLPTHLSVPDVDTAARLRGDPWPATLATGRARLQVLAQQFGAHPAPEQVVRAVAGYSSVDFELLLTSATWFAAHPDSGLSARQVPIEGLHSKWLDAAGRRALVATLAGVQDLGLVDARPVPLEFTYLDPEHRASEGRLHDSVAPGTPMVPQYVPEVVIISENKDTAVMFPPVPGAVAVQGHGMKGPPLVAQVPWLAGARAVLYWGDLDAAGFEIVHRYRAAGVAVRTILMDPDTLGRYARFQATTDRHGGALVRPAPKALTHLTEVEQATYRMLTDPDSPHPIRVEQERIPLQVAEEHVHAALS